MQCERCRSEPVPGKFDLWDYCAHCSKNLCPECMAKGCCKEVPARSGMGLDYADEEQEQAEPNP